MVRSLRKSFVLRLLLSEDELLVVLVEAAEDNALMLLIVSVPDSN
jgi:hypothetical protein